MTVQPLSNLLMRMTSAAENPTSPAPMLSEIVTDARAWTRQSLSETDWTLPIQTAALDELEALVVDLARNPVPTPMLLWSDYELPACKALMNEARRRLDHGPGVILLDRLPIAQWSRRAIEDIFWLLGSMLARPVVQTIDGQAMVEVTDTGVKKTVGVRGYRTGHPQPPHVDNSFNHTPPDYVSLLSLRQAQQGGLSRFVSFFTIHNRLREYDESLLERLYQPFYQDRQGDFWPDEPQVILAPVFELAPDLRCRYTHFTIPAGYQTAKKTMDEATRKAFDAITDLVMDPQLHCEFMIEPGQLQIVNNRFCGHGRGEYVDANEPSMRRLLLRLWHRDRGRRSYSGR